MICPISDDLRFNFHDSNCIAVEQRSITKDSKFTKKENIGAEKWHNVGYYGSLDQAAEQVLKRHPHLFLPDSEGEIVLKALVIILADATELLRIACAKATRKLVKEALAKQPKPEAPPSEV